MILFRRPGINSDGTITLLHGTTVSNAANILNHGFRPMRPAEVAGKLAAKYGLRPQDVLDHISFEFARGRTDRDRVHFTSDPSIAQEYTVPEVVQDALSAVWSMLYGSAHVTRESLREQHAWVRREGARMAQPTILAVTMPWSAVGDHAFGRRLTLREWQAFGRIEDLHNISVPIRALHDVQIALYPSVAWFR